MQLPLLKHLNSLLEQVPAEWNVEWREAVRKVIKEGEGEREEVS